MLLVDVRFIHRVDKLLHVQLLVRGEHVLLLHAVQAADRRDEELVGAGTIGDLGVDLHEAGGAVLGLHHRLPHGQRPGRVQRADHAVVHVELGQHIIALQVAGLGKHDVGEVGHVVQIDVHADDEVHVLVDLHLLFHVGPPFDGVAGVPEQIARARRVVEIGIGHGHVHEVAVF